VPSKVPLDYWIQAKKSVVDIYQERGKHTFLYPPWMGRFFIRLYVFALK
jgi:hypothetical protein